MHEVAVVCCTRDRAGVLREMLWSLAAEVARTSGLTARVLVVDDSRTSTGQRGTRAVVASLQALEVYYHGAADQERLVADLLRESANRRDVDVTLRHVKRLGSSERDLGGVRNHASLVLAQMPWRPTAVLLLDDDIVLRAQSRSVRALVRKASEHPEWIVGGILTGMPDTSTLERLELGHATAGRPLIGRPRVLTISGGFMACAPCWLRQASFPRLYNEDLLWMELCRRSGASIRRVRSASALHRRAPPPRSLGAALGYELQGELILEGLRWAGDGLRSGGQFGRDVVDVAYWRGVQRGYASWLWRRLRTMQSRERNARGLRRVREAYTKAVEIVVRCAAASLRDTALQYVRAQESWRLTIGEAARLCREHFP